MLFKCEKCEIYFMRSEREIVVVADSEEAPFLEVIACPDCGSKGEVRPVSEDFDHNLVASQRRTAFDWLNRILDDVDVYGKPEKLCLLRRDVQTFMENVGARAKQKSQ